MFQSVMGRDLLMLLTKIAIVGVLGLAAIWLGSWASAWLRGCFAIAKSVLAVNWMEGNGYGVESNELPWKRQIRPEDVQRFTPAWIIMNRICATISYVVFGVAIWLCFGWVAACIGIPVVYLIAQSLGMYGAHRYQHYFVRQISDTFARQNLAAAKFGDLTDAAELQDRLFELSRAFPEILEPRSPRDFAAPLSASPSVRVLVGDEAEIPESWLGDPVLQSKLDSHISEALRELMKDGDELREFCSPAETWEKLYGRGGIAVIRDGRVVAHVRTAVN